MLEVEGAAAAVERFLARLPREAPPLAAVEHVRSALAAPACGEREFAIVESTGRGPAAAPVAADTPPCAACLAELRDPGDRRHRYPFVNCTDCGPRFTIVRGVPYDRARTTMAGFAMCADCRAEYEDPLDRRFHAEPNACPACGPRARLRRRARARDGRGRRPRGAARRPRRRRRRRRGAPRRPRRRRQGARRLPPRVPRRRRGRRRRAARRASTARTSRSRSWPPDLDGGARARRARRRRRRRSSLARAPDRDRAAGGRARRSPAPSHPGRPRPRRDAAVDRRCTTCCSRTPAWRS